MVIIVDMIRTVLLLICGEFLIFLQNRLPVRIFFYPEVYDFIENC